MRNIYNALSMIINPFRKNIYIIYDTEDNNSTTIVIILYEL